MSALLPQSTGAETTKPVNLSEKTTQKTAGTEKQTSKAAKPLPNFHQVHPYLYRGGEPTEEGLRELQKMGIKTIIDLRAPSERKMDEPQIAKQLGMKYINLPMDWHAPTKKQVKTFLEAVDRAKAEHEKITTDNSEKKTPAVFLHCAHGSDRTGCLIGIWRVARENWPYDDTYKEMRKYYFGPKYTQLSDAVRNAGAFSPTRDETKAD
ncbi:MAG TPA: tyrosine-protein phosphatase [Candidatus Obscuribacterales bacterium]